MADGVTVSLRRRENIDAVIEKGDFCFDSAGKVIMACPICALVFYCKHTVVSAEPLTLSPSVVGPETERDYREQINPPCRHHFWVKDGVALEVHQ